LKASAVPHLYSRCGQNSGGSAASSAWFTS
jgi:hypothetical protein